MPIIAGILQRAKDAGVVRHDVEITDLPLMQMAIASIAECGSRDVAPNVWRRTRASCSTELRAENATSTLEPRALDQDQVAGVMASIASGRGRR